MSAIWKMDEQGWSLLPPSGFPTEAALHELVERSPQLLPLAGSPKLVILGKEVSLGGNSADLIAVEPSGQLVIIELKLKKNAEARRAVVAQVLTYAAYLNGTTVEVLEQGVLANHLSKRGYPSLIAAMIANDQDASFDEGSFRAGLSESLNGGRFRLVIVLDEVPSELIRLVGYLEIVAERLTIDLIAVSSYDVGGTKIVVPQRIEPAKIARDEKDVHPAVVASPDSVSQFVEGSSAFRNSIAKSASDQQALLTKLVDWADDLEAKGFARLLTTIGKGRMALRPILRSYDSGLATIWNENGGALSLWRSVIVRHAPELLPRIEELAAPTPVGTGTTTRTPSDQLLQALTDAYRISAEGKLSSNATDIV